MNPRALYAEDAITTSSFSLRGLLGCC